MYYPLRQLHPLPARVHPFSTNFENQLPKFLLSAALPPFNRHSPHADPSVDRLPSATHCDDLHNPSPIPFLKLKGVTEHDKEEVPKSLTPSPTSLSWRNVQVQYSYKPEWWHFHRQHPPASKAVDGSLTRPLEAGWWWLESHASTPSCLVRKNNKIRRKNSFFFLFEGCASTGRTSVPHAGKGG